MGGNVNNEIVGRNEKFIAKINSELRGKNVMSLFMLYAIIGPNGADVKAIMSGNISAGAASVIEKYMRLALLEIDGDEGSRQ
jgi:hypothetical protein